MNRVDVRDLLNCVIRTSDKCQVVCHLGPVAHIAAETIPTGRVLPLFGAMGMVIPVSLGVSLASSSDVVAIEGDGGLMMNLGGLATAATLQPRNLLCIILDNGGYQTTGGQTTSFSGTRGIYSVLSACGFSQIRYAHKDNLQAALTWGMQPGLRAVICKTSPLTFDLTVKTKAPSYFASEFSTSCRADTNYSKNSFPS